MNDFIKDKLRRISHFFRYVFVTARKSDFFLLNTPGHGNLGDQAITIAELQFFKEAFPQKVVTEFRAYDFGNLEKLYAFFTPKNITIFIHGGGYLGNIWPEEELRFRSFLQAFKKHKIIVFPQTVTFDFQTESGRKFYEESKEAYSAAPKLTICAREQQSAQLLKEHFPDLHCLLTPDIVTVLNHSTPENSDRHGILMCLRRDHERSLTTQETSLVQDILRNNFPQEPLKVTDTVLDTYISKEDRNYQLDKKLDEFKSAKLVITDRLHGMVFAAITGTPCIAMSNANKKVKGVYHWLKEVPYITYIDDTAEFEAALKSLNLQKTYTYDNTIAWQNFEPLCQLISQNT